MIFLFLVILLLYLISSKKIKPSYFSALFLLLSIFYGPMLVEQSYMDYQLTYGSDAYYYYKEMLSAFSGKDCSQSLAPFFVCVNYLNMTSIDNASHIHVVFLNILIYSLICSFLFEFFKVEGKEKVSVVLMFIVCLNPLTILTVLRATKEVFLMASYVLVFISCAFYSRGFYFRSSIYLSLGALMALYLKPYGYIFVLAPFFVFLFLDKISMFRFFVLFLIFLAGVWFFYGFIGDIISVSKAHANLNDSSGGRALFGFFRFFLGPGPYYSLDQLIYSDRFLAFTKVGDFYIFLGSLFWYALVTAFFLKKVIFSFRGRWEGNNYLYYFYFSAFFYMVAYVVSYGGTGDTRHRAVMYFLLSLPMLRSVLMSPKIIFFKARSLG